MGPTLLGHLGNEYVMPNISMLAICRLFRMRRLVCGTAALWAGSAGYFEHGKPAAVHDRENQDKAPQFQSP